MGVVRIGILTGGGDCPGLNAVIRAIVRKGVGVYGHSFVGFRDGWRGVLEDDAVELDLPSVRGILHRGGTILGSSGTDPRRADGGVDRIVRTLQTHGIDGLIVIGGEGTLGAGAEIAERGVPIVGVPKTIDNDLPGTDITVGFHTAVQVATDAVDRLHSTAESHDRVMVVEVMGRHSGWIALYAAVAGGADMLLIPEHPFDIEEVCRHLRHRHMATSSFSIVVVAEGAMPVPGTMEEPRYELDENGFPRLGGISYLVAPEIEKRTGYGCRVTVLGHVQRGGSPVAFDRVLGTRFGLAAVDLATAGGWGRMVSRRGQDVRDVPLTEALGPRKDVPLDLYREAEVFFG
ncbi:MAG: pyrophosphate--fructose 6-phosphate 1-phosphotransferase [Actinomycetota bacterium]|nr:MAG: pyrophosphate--fructose 6-phosphate 1-phosphotransferase [Actinomycetota bacterium]